MSREIYTNGHEQTALDFMRRRTLRSHGAFIEPLLKPGMHVLDLGCGPGTLTLDIARKVGPQGKVTGVDRSDSQFVAARAEAGDLPATFRAMDAYALEFRDASFDGIFSHALFEHLARPLEALHECHRVLKPGGFIGLRSPDWGGMVIQPMEDALYAAFQARLELQTRNGGNVHAGRHLGEWLRRAGFDEVEISADYEIYPDTRLIVEHIASQLEMADEAVHAAAWRSWGENPEAFFAQAWFAATGRKKL